MVISLLDNEKVMMRPCQFIPTDWFLTAGGCTLLSLPSRSLYSSPCAADPAEPWKLLAVRAARHGSDGCTSVSVCAGAAPAVALPLAAGSWVTLGARAAPHRRHGAKRSLPNIMVVYYPQFIVGDIKSLNGN